MCTAGSRALSVVRAAELALHSRPGGEFDAGDVDFFHRCACFFGLFHQVRKSCSVIISSLGFPYFMPVLLLLSGFSSIVALRKSYGAGNFGYSSLAFAAARKGHMNQLPERQQVQVERHREWMRGARWSRRGRWRRRWTME